jgi:hypothetical protein
MLAMTMEPFQRSWKDYSYLSSINLPNNNIWKQWDNTAFITEETMNQIQQEPSGEQHASIIRELNVVAANCHLCQAPNSNTRISSAPQALSSD